MAKLYIGKNRSEQKDWLLNEWLRHGPPVCFLQGFSGSGKSDLANEIRGIAKRELDWPYAVLHEVANRSTPIPLETLMELAGALSEQKLTEMESVLVEQANPNLGYVIEVALRRPVLIILDEAQRLMGSNVLQPGKDILEIMAHLKTRQDLPGRLLLVSDRVIESGARWADWIPKRTLQKLEQSEAIELLWTRLKEQGIESAIPANRPVEDLVDALDNNPRAIEVLVGALAFEPLDEIIGSKPELWDTHDRSVSPEFLKALELNLLERILTHMDSGEKEKLQLLSVHRRSFKKKAIELVCEKSDNPNQLIVSLVARFLMNHRSGTYSLNPLVREVSLPHLKKSIKRFRQAHNLASQFHGRYFRASQLGRDLVGLSDSFAELRYHLIHAEQEGQLRVLANRFTEHLRSQFSGGTQVPSDPEELDERIAVLSILLAEGGAKSLEYYLARCYQERGRSSDREKALFHAQLSVGAYAPIAHWSLLMRLTHRLLGTAEAMKVVNSAKELVHPQENLFDIYQYGALMYEEQDAYEKGIALLREGINRINPESAAHSLYQTGIEIHARKGNIKEALSLFYEGAKRIPPKYNLFVLYQCIAEILTSQERYGEAAKLLEDGIKRIPAEYSASVLYQQCSKTLAHLGETNKAIALLKQGVDIIPARYNAFWLYESAFELLSDTGDWEAATRWLQEGVSKVPRQYGLPSVYSSAIAQFLRLGKLRDGLYWAQAAAAEFGNDSRWTVLVERCRDRIRGSISEETALDVYISYAWGEDTSVDGRRREQIVDLLCTAALDQGYVIGRDKDRIKAGASIDRFAKMIASARRIVAVISDKSLHSEYCMVQELYRAYHRCYFNRADFQATVIAIVLDDAKPLLKDDNAVLGLAEIWKTKFELLRERLLAIDPEKKSRDEWDYLEFMGEMVQRLPGMLGALRDIVMPRGFETVVKDDFKSVLALFPPLTPK